jgi:hypothetical protein
MWRHRRPRFEGYPETGPRWLRRPQLQLSSRQRDIITDGFFVCVFPLQTKGPGQEPNIFKPRL